MRSTFGIIKGRKNYQPSYFALKLDRKIRFVLILISKIVVWTETAVIKRLGKGGKIHGVGTKHNFILEKPTNYSSLVLG